VSLQGSKWRVQIPLPIKETRLQVSEGQLNFCPFRLPFETDTVTLIRIKAAVRGSRHSASCASLCIFAYEALRRASPRTLPLWSDPLNAQKHYGVRCVNSCTLAQLAQARDRVTSPQCVSRDWTWTLLHFVYMECLFFVVGMHPRHGLNPYFGRGCFAPRSSSRRSARSCRSTKMGQTCGRLLHFHTG
jgi:hypothetical protein